MTILGLVERILKEPCIYCGQPSQAVEMKGLKGVRWIQYAPCPKRVVKESLVLGELVDAEEVPLGI